MKMNLESAKKMLSLHQEQYPIILGGRFRFGKHTMLVSFAEENNLSMANIDLREATTDDIFGFRTISGFATPIWWEKDILYFNRLEEINRSVLASLCGVIHVDYSTGDRYINGSPLRKNQRIVFGLNINLDLNSLSFDPIFWSKCSIINIGE